jgi:hypothetical protein
MSPDGAFTPLPAGGGMTGRLEVWVDADTAVDNPILLRSDDGGGYALVDPHNGWREIRHFASYEAAYRWLAEEAYERADGR